MSLDLFSSSDEGVIQDLIQQANELLERTVFEGNREATINELRTVINLHNQLYYGESRSVISDHLYDLLFNKLKELEAEYEEEVPSDSPTQKVGEVLQANLLTVKHLKPMLSLDNSYNLEDLQRFDKRVKDGLQIDKVVDYAVELKYDGSSIALVYENNHLIRAATRGNGVEGDDITENAKVINGIPHYADFKKLGIHRVEVRGEVVIEQSVFQKLNDDRSLKNKQLELDGKRKLELFKNARNTAAGTLRLKDVAEVKRRQLEAILYQVGYAEDEEGNDITDRLKPTHADYVKMLSELGFRTGIQDFTVESDMELIAEYCLKWQDKREEAPIEIDGMVIKVNEMNYQTILGKTAHHPKWAIAFKFKAKQATSILRRVEFQVGRTGAVTPVAKIDPLQLMGVEISSISLHNEGFIKEKDIFLGDVVIVERAGDVIPYIVGSVKEKRDGSEEVIIFPEYCPSCQHQLVKSEDESVWRCIYPDCPAQIEERLIHFASINAMDIQGLGQEIIKTFIKEGVINSISDIYQLDYDKISQLEGFREKSIQNLKKSIETSKDNESWRLLTGLGIRHVGVTTSKTLAQEVELLTDFKEWSLEDFQQLRDVGPKVSVSLHDFFNDDLNIALIKHLAELGVNIKKEESVVSSEKLKDKTFLFTGTLPTLSRDEGKTLVEQHGGRILSNVSKNLDFLVVGEKAGSKLKKAEKISTIQIIDESAFLELIS